MHLLKPEIGSLKNQNRRLNLTNRAIDTAIVRPVNDTIAIDHEVLTTEEICELLRLHRSMVYKLASEGRIPGFRIGIGWRFRKDLIVRWLAARSMGVPLTEGSYRAAAPGPRSVMKSMLPRA
jgi:excisionase family DNA binding protein